MRVLPALWCALCTVAVLLTSLADADAQTKYPAYKNGKIVRKDPRFDKLIPQNAVIEELANKYEGKDIEWSEGPVWIKDGGYLLFSDIPNNRIMKWKDGEGLSVFLRPAGYTGEGAYGKEPGTNGLTLNKKGELVACEHGDRRISVLDKSNVFKTTLVAKYEGKRFNSPNDLAFKSNGDLYFTDPPYGLPDNFDDKRRELDHCGVYRLSTDGKVTLLTDKMTRPNGIAFSPDEKKLYVAQSDPKAAIWMVYNVKEDGTVDEGKVFFDSTSMVGKQKGLPDGLKVDTAGNLFATGPGGVLVFAPDGTHIGSIETGEATANCAWGEDGTVLYITADMYIVRVKTSTKGW